MTFDHNETLAQATARNVRPSPRNTARIAISPDALDLATIENGFPLES